MGDAQFCAGMFELADLHVETISGDDYATYLNEL